MPPYPQFAMVSINCFIDRARRSSFHAISGVAAACKFKGVVQSGAVCDSTRHLLGENLLAPRFG
jgi:hypothetical protein